MRLISSGSAIGIVIMVLTVVHVQSAVMPHTPRWTTQVDPNPTGVTVANDATTVVRGGEYPRGWVALLDGRNGSVLWQRPSQGESIRTATLTAAGDRILIQDSRTIQPRTERSTEQMILLNRQGGKIWEHRADGAATMSPDGKVIATYDPQSEIGLRVYAGANGNLIWQVPSGELGQIVESVQFSGDGSRLLVRSNEAVHLLTSAGKRLWTVKTEGRVRSLSLMDDGSTAVILAGSDNDPSLMVVSTDGRHVTTEIRELKDSNTQVAWNAALVDGEGRVIVQGESPASYHFRAMNREGRYLWARDMPSPKVAASPAFQMLEKGLMLFVVQTNDSHTFRVLDAVGETVQTLDFAQTVIWGISPNGRFLTTIDSSGRVRSFNLLVMPASPPPAP